MNGFKSGGAILLVFFAHFILFTFHFQLSIIFALIMHKLLTNPLVLLRGAIALLYTALGIYLFFNLHTLGVVSREYRPFLAGVILLYGLFRLYRFGVEVKELNNEKE